MTADSRTKAREFLRTHPMGILSTVSGSGQPWGSAIYYVADDDFNIYFVTRTGTFKYKNLGEQPHAALTVADPATQMTVQLAGIISQLPLEQYADVLFNKLSAVRPANAEDWVPPLAKVHAGDYMPLKLTPSTVQYADYGHPHPQVGASYIEHIM